MRVQIARILVRRGREQLVELTCGHTGRVGLDREPGDVYACNLAHALPDANCAWCALWNPEPGEREHSAYGTCQAHAPSLADRGVGSIRSARWPVTLRTDRCGEYAPVLQSDHSTPGKQ